MLFESLMLRQTPPTKAIISSLIYSLSYDFDFGSIFQRYNPKKDTKNISNHEQKHCLIYFPDSGVVPEISNVKGPVNLKFAVYIGGDEILLSYTRIIIVHKPT